MAKTIINFGILACLVSAAQAAYGQNSDYSNPDYSTDSYKHNYSTSSSSHTTSSYTPSSTRTTQRTYSGDVLVSPSRSQGSYYATSQSYAPSYKSHSYKQ